ncbi:hypothetical protein NC653_014918 [Populus alba x Populus x berolinensis]|uniref:Neutral/alkaline non-lysosomal ceramidase C-terminal domain-containing protein n=1 Tax=Populus alba x Populus x berolinensis TaxID=444605 RepID=A0AAD6W504_9ROSI|nr:hypothetical protein NC653_014918 [Populus alba x Populus x berolinensis]
MKDLIDRWIKRQGPEILPFQVLMGKLTTLSVPGELTAMAGRRPREAVKETLISNGGGEFTEETHVHLLPWKSDNSSFYTSFATIEGEVPKETSSGVYRPRHSGSSKKAQDSPIEYFTGASSAFTMS